MQDTILITTYPNKSRELKYLINEVLKKGLAKEVKKLNYAKSFVMVDGKVQKRQQEMIMIVTTKEKKAKLENLIRAKNPQKDSEIIFFENNTADL